MLISNIMRLRKLYWPINKRSGFTLIEMMVVVSIIGLLASVVIGSIGDARLSAQYTVAKADMINISNLIQFAKTNKQSDLRTITGSACTECACRTQPGNLLPSADLSNLSPTDACVESYLDVIAVINDNAGGLTSINNPPFDPWGAPYIINENENEFHGGVIQDDCVQDSIASAGPNGTYYDSDDVHYNIPLVTCGPAPAVIRPNLNWD